MTKIMTDKEKIIKYLDYKGISKNKFYVTTGLSVGFLDSGSSLGVDKLRLIIDNYHDLNPAWFFNDKNQMLITEGTQKALEDGKEPEISQYRLKTDYFGVEKQLIPLYEVKASAGLNTLFNSNIQQVPLDFISVPNAPTCDGAVYVRGDSMYPILKSGDIACYKTIYSLDNIYFGEMHLIDADIEGDQYLTFKYVQRSSKGDDFVRLVSHNEHYAPRDIPKASIRAIALVKLSIRYNTIS